nr:putative ribonuclease H-like domain-containing protein [Tanacetum cinerariifolium]
MILNTLDNLGKFEAKGDEGYFIGYSMSSKAFRVFNKRTGRVEENLHVVFLENKAIEKGAGPNWLFDIDSLTKSMHYVPVDAGTNSTNLSGTQDAANQEVKKDVSSLRYIALPNWAHDALLESSSSKPRDESSSQVPKGSRNLNPTASSSNPPADQLETLTVESLIPTVSSPVPTACLNDSPEPSSEARLILKRVANQEETPSLDNILSLTNRFEDILGVTTSSDESIGVEADVEAMQEELLQFKIQKVWTLVDCPKGVRPIGTKWVLKNMKDERGIVVRNKARLVAQGHTQEEGIDYDEVFAPVARIEAIRLFLAYASFMGFTVYQMNVKSDFLYDTIDEEPYEESNSQVPEGSGNHNSTASTLNPSVEQMETLTVESPIPTASSPVPTAYLNDSSETSSAARLVSKRVAHQEESPSLDNILSLTNRFDDILGVSISSEETIGVGADVLVKYWGVLKMLKIGPRLIPLGEFNTDFHPMVDFIAASPL